jgi:catechol 2,3-dioxygenase-like lactoylglutathione lyase family enzyme
MSTAFEHVVVEALDPAAQARWWADALGWHTSFQDDDEVDIDAPAGAPPMRLVFVPVRRLPGGPQRLHLDLASRDAGHQRELVDLLLAAGARRADVGQRDVPWEVLADPEGTVFCVLEPRPVYAGTGAVAAVVLQAADPEAAAGFWQAATGWQRADHDLVALRAPGGGPFLELYPVAAPAHGSGHRLHLDVRPLPGRPQDDEVARLRGLGATPLDVGQGDVPWQVLADPEGNPLCVLSTPAEPPA